jgi:hypothetical protein
VRNRRPAGLPPRSSYHSPDAPPPLKLPPPPLRVSLLLDGPESSLEDMDESMHEKATAVATDASSASSSSSRRLRLVTPPKVTERGLSARVADGCT